MQDLLSDITGQLRDRLQVLYGPRLERLVLFGSHARGDGDIDSDTDGLVVLKGPGGRRSGS